METDGWIAPTTHTEARDSYEAVWPTAQVVVREVARSMDFDREEYRNRVTSEVVETARDALFASLLQVTVGTAEEFQTWREQREGSSVTVEVEGSKYAENTAWLEVPFADRILAVTFQEKQDAALATLRRLAFGRVYRDVVEGTRDP